MKFKKSVIIPILLLVYLGVMAYMGLGRLQEGKYLQYFGTLGGTIFIIVMLHFTLRRHEKLKQQRKALEEEEEAQYTTYADEDSKKQ